MTGAENNVPLHACAFYAYISRLNTLRWLISKIPSSWRSESNFVAFAVDDSETVCCVKYVSSFCGEHPNLTHYSVHVLFSKHSTFLTDFLSKSDLVNLTSLISLYMAVCFVLHLREIYSETFWGSSACDSYKNTRSTVPKSNHIHLQRKPPLNALFCSTLWQPYSLEGKTKTECLLSVLGDI